MVIYGNKQEMDEDLFDQMVEGLHQPINTYDPPTPATHTRRKPDGTYDKKPLDPDYFQNMINRIYQNRSNVQSVDEQSAVNPIYPNTVKATGVWTREPIVETPKSSQ